MILSDHQYRFAIARATIFRTALSKVKAQATTPGTTDESEQILSLTADLHGVELAISAYERAIGRS